MEKEELAIIKNACIKNNTPTSLISLLLEVQKKIGYVSDEAVETISEKTGILKGSIVSVLTFYEAFRRKEAGKVEIGVCVGTACHVKGSRDILNAFKTYLGIGDNEDTDKEKRYTVKEVACLGCCSLAVAVKVGEIIYGNVTAKSVGEVLNDYEIISKEEEVLDKVKGESETTMRLCRCSSCAALGSDAIYKEAISLRKRYNLNIGIEEVSCLGMANLSPTVEFIKAGISYRYVGIATNDFFAVLFKHTSSKRPILSAQKKIREFGEYIINGFKELEKKENTEIKNIKRIATLGAGEVAGADIKNYKKHGGFRALEKVFTMDREDIINEIEKSGLRGRGGAGFLTASKWRMVLRSISCKKYVLINADEGDPGAFMDRMLIETQPLKVLEGALIAAYTVGASEIIIYVRNEYPKACSRMKEVISLCEKEGIIGENIANGFSCTIRVSEGAGAFVCGEETALISALEGKRGTPRFRPPYPAENGVDGKPSLVNNVETISLVPWIILNGAKEFNAIGTKHGKGTKTFALAGKVNVSGLVEVPMGLSIRDIIMDIGGGVSKGKAFKAVQIGGPSGGCLSEKALDTCIDYENLNHLGVIMGSGGLVVLDEEDCIVDTARYFIEFTKNESCGKCTFCRIGTSRMLDILTRICEGNGRENDIEALISLGKSLKKASTCGLGKSAPNPVLSSIAHFREEYEEHLQGYCRAGKCKPLSTFEINDNCIGCGICFGECPVSAIKGELYEKFEIDNNICVRCGNCRSVCPKNAVKAVRCSK